MVRTPQRRPARLSGGLNMHVEIDSAQHHIRSATCPVKMIVISRQACPSLPCAVRAAVAGSRIAGHASSAIGFPFSQSWQPPALASGDRFRPSVDRYAMRAARI